MIEQAVGSYTLLPAANCILLMPERKPFLLRVDPALLEALQRWADDELRSLNGQIEYILRQALTERKRLKERKTPPRDSGRS